MSEKLLIFLRDVLTKVENEKLTKEQLEVLTTFFISWQAIENDQPIDRDTLMKYCTMGWYVYKQLEN